MLKNLIISRSKRAPKLGAAEAEANTESALADSVIKKDFPILNRLINGKPLTYLDNASTTQKPRIVIDALKNYYETMNANIHRGIHTLSEEATEAYEATRKTVAEFIGADYREMVFTRNTTEAVNLVMRSWGEKNISAGDEIAVSELEHHSNLVPWQQLCKKTGAILKSDLTITKRTKLVAVTQMSNVLGTILPVKEIVEKAHAVGAKVLVDGAQSVPHMPVNVKDLDCDFLVFSSHKMLGPTGVGVLYAKRELLESMDPFLFGGDMVLEVSDQDATWNEVPWKFEAGTPNIADVIAFGKAIEYLKNIGMENVAAHDKKLTAYALKKFEELDFVTLYGPKDPEKIGGVISFNVHGVHAHDVASILNSHGVAIRSGYHCCMPLMKRLGVPATARMSFYIYNDEHDVDIAIKAIKTIREIADSATLMYSRSKEAPKLGATEAEANTESALADSVTINLYAENILDHYQSPRNYRRLTNADFSATEYNPLCGDRLRMDVKLTDGRVSDVGFSGEGCAISQASASMLTEFLTEKSLEELEKISENDILNLLGVPISAGRMKCALLSLATLKKAFILSKYAKAN